MGVFRLAVMVALLLLAAGCTGGKAPETPVLSVEIGDTMPSSDDEDAYNTLGDRYWFVSPDIVARLERPCADVRLTVRAQALFNGRPDRGDPYLGSGGKEALGPRSAGFVLRSYEEAYAEAGDTVEFIARATCVLEGSPTAVTARKRFELPTAACDGGPPRAHEISGQVTVREDGEGPAVRLEPGDLVRPGSLVVVGEGARAVVGAPECNGFSVTLSPGTYDTGSYQGSDRGLVFSGTQIDAVGDGHAGGFYVGGWGVSVHPVGEGCRDCPVPTPARYGVRTIGGRVVVRVEQAGVRVQGGPGPAVRVRAGEQTTVICASSASCRVTKPRLFQPNEPWLSSIAGVERPVRRIVVTARGMRPRAGALAPPRATVRTSVLPAAGGIPEQVLVAWRRETRTQAGPKAGLLQSEQGVLVWQARPTRRSTQWRVVYERRYPRYLSLRYRTGDVTRDGHADVLVNASQGSSGCGPWRVVAVADGRTRDIFYRDTCETEMRIEDGALIIDEPVGPCPTPQGSVHCFGGRRQTSKRWNGSRLVAVDSSVECVLARLDPERDCRPRRR